MDDLFKRIETGQYVAYSAVFWGPNGVMSKTTATALFKTEDDARLYADTIKRWWNSMFPACCIQGCISVNVTRELVSFDGKLIHGMSGRRWDFERVEKGARTFATWKSSLPGHLVPALDECAILARDMGVPYADEDRIRCLPCLHDRCCLLDCLLCLIPNSCPRCCWCG
jgi:hypothetical protein